MPKFFLPFQITGTYEIEAENIEEALRKSWRLTVQELALAGELEVFGLGEDKSAEPRKVAAQ